MSIKDYIEGIFRLVAGITSIVIWPIVLWVFCPGWPFMIKLLIALFTIPITVFCTGLAIFYITKESKEWCGREDINT